MKGIRFEHQGTDAVPALCRAIANNPAAKAKVLGLNVRLLRRLTGYPIGLCLLIMGMKQAADWDESKHPRVPAGSDEGGQFTSINYSGATTAEGVAYRFNTKHVGKLTVDLGTLPKGVAIKVADTLDRLQQRYQGVAKLDTVMVVPGDHLSGKENWGEYHLAEGLILLNGDTLSHDFETLYQGSTVPPVYANTDPKTMSLADAVAQADRPPDLGFHPGATNGIAEVVAHEFGHAVYAGLGQHNSMSYGEAALPSGLGLVGDTLHMMIKDRYSDGQKPVSAYALKNSDEWFAETFSAIYTGTGEAAKNPQVKALKEFLRIVADPKKWTEETNWTDKLPIEQRAAIRQHLLDEASLMRIDVSKL